MLGKLLFIFFSLSFRSSILDVPYDYEYRIGAETEKAYIDLLYEREIGIGGLGLDYEQELNSIYNFQPNINWYRRDVKDIDYQTVKFMYPLETYSKVGFCLNSDHWDDPRVLASFHYAIHNIDFSMETNFVGREIMSVKLSNKWAVAESSDKKISVYVEPIFRYKSFNEDTFWQFKIEVKMQINRNGK